MNKGKTLLILGTVILLLVALSGPTCWGIEEETESLEPMCLTEIQIPLLIETMEFKNTKDKSELKELMKQCLERKKQILALIPDESSINYFSHKTIITTEIFKINSYYSNYKQQYNSIIKQEEQTKITKEKAKVKNTTAYPNATIIWNYLRNLGYNKYVCAGIMGNIMAEVGGHTLNIRPNLYSTGKGYYGICQWSVKYYPSVKGANLNSQLNFLAKTIKNEFNTYGYKYAKGYNYNSFLKSSSASTAARAFAVVYERCSSATYQKRQNNAVKAYNYFAG